MYLVLTFKKWQFRMLSGGSHHWERRTQQLEVCFGRVSVPWKAEEDLQEEGRQV